MTRQAISPLLAIKTLEMGLTLVVVASLTLADILSTGINSRYGGIFLKEVIPYDLQDKKKCLTENCGGDA